MLAREAEEDKKRREEELAREAAEEAERATYGSDLVHECHLDVPLHIGHCGLSDLDGHLGYVPLNLGSNSILS